MDWFKGLTYFFADKKWFGKLFVGALVTSVPVVEAITNGYQMRVIENLKANRANPLPEWSNMGEMFGKGFKLWLAVNIFYIPSIIISALSWFLGIPLFVVMLGNLIAGSTSDNIWEQKGIAFLFSHLIVPLLGTILTGIGVLLGSILLPAVFFFAPAMALRCAETDSLLRTLNPFALIKFVLRHLGNYIIARVLILVMLMVMHSVAVTVGGATLVLAGLGALVGWFLISAARFVSRLAWAYYLAKMRMNETTATVHQWQPRAA